MIRRKWAVLLLVGILLLTATGCGPKEPEAPAADKTADVIVVGGGGAGLAAAVSAAENGASVILVEKASNLGGNTLVSGGVMNAVDPERQKNVSMNNALLNELKSLLERDESEFGDFAPAFRTLKEQITEYLEGDTSVLFDSVELHMIHTYLGGTRTDLQGNTISSEYELIEVLCNNALGAIEWLEGYGQKFSDEIGTVLGALWPRTHSTGGGRAYIDTLSGVAEDLGVEILLETAGKELITEDGRVVGVKAAQADGTELILRANNGVVLATGGFGENPEMRAQYNTYWPEMPLTMPSTNIPTANGDGITMAQQVGADLVGMGFIQLMPSSDPETGVLFNGLWGSAETQVFINKQGKRFVNEYAERDVLAKAALEQEDGLFFIICDAQIAGDRNLDHLIEAEDVIKADTLEELAEKIGVPVETFVAEIEKYNSYVDAQHDPDFGKSNFGNYKITTGPFYATPRSPSVHHTMGGLKIDTQARVISTEGQPIAGLYAAGEVCGGIHAGNRLGGNAITDILVFGRIAGESAAQKK
ncbi:MAG: flavocytochrome c [Bacillota bacterium]|jgi:urocanate reductase